MKFKVYGLKEWEYEIIPHRDEFCVQLTTKERNFWLYPTGLFAVKQENQEGFKHPRDCAPDIYQCVRSGLIYDAMVVL